MPGAKSTTTKKDDFKPVDTKKKKTIAFAEEDSDGSDDFMVVPRAGQVKATGASKAFFDDSDEDDKGFGAGRARAPSAFKKPSMAKPPPA